MLLGALGCSEPAYSAVPTTARIELPSITVESGALDLPEPMRRGETFRRGLVLGPLEAPDDESQFRRTQARLLDRAVALGATDLQLVVRWMQTDVEAVEIAPFETVHDDLLSWVIDQAKRRKLRVLLTLRLAVENESERAVRNLKPASWERWWWSYRRVVLHYARVASMRKVAGYSIGSELGSTEGQTDRWRKLIKEARKIFKGKLTYFASADSFDKIAFWDALDVVGISVDQDKPRDAEQLRARLEPLTKKLARSSKVKDRGYVIAEHGCGTGTPNAQHELMCQSALYKSFGDQSQLQGVYVRPAPERESAAARSAADVMKHWYRKSRG